MMPTPVASPERPARPAAMQLGVCYYPEQWDPARWADDARRMRELGLRVVRIAEFAWSRMEPAEGRYDWEWLDQAIATLAAEGLQVVLGTPTAAPPLWLMQAHPDIAPVGADGRRKGFGARRHYDFSHPAFFEASRRIVTAMAQRYGQHPAVIAWQTDNEYGCHDTILSWSPAALQRFQGWLARRYGDIAALNTAWGTAFWGSHLARFEDVVLPIGQPTSPLPAHALDFRRFASDEVLRYNRMQVAVLREHAPGRDVLHNFMGFFGEFDHHAVAADLDVAAWDNYPLGFLDSMPFFSEAERLAHARSGHPDVSAFHHDLYRSLGRGRCWVMEQQAGPVNWAPYNALPLPGMVRAWTWEAFAHGAELVSYFRWRQAPFGQEQMHSGLNRPDNVLDQGGVEAGQVAQELQQLAATQALSADTHPAAERPAPVAIVIDYPSKWMTDLQPQGADQAYFAELFRYYSALRSLGLDVDFAGPDSELSGYALVVLPGLLHAAPQLVEQLSRSAAVVVAGPRAGSKTEHFAIPEALPPGPLQAGLGLRVRGVESMRPGRRYEVCDDSGPIGHGHRWRDLVETTATTAQVLARFEDGWPAWVQQDRWHLHAGTVDAALLQAWLAAAARQAGLQPTALPEGLRLSRLGHWQFAIHFGPGEAVVPAPAGTDFLLGGPVLAPAGVALWRTSEHTEDNTTVPPTIATKDSA